MPYVPRKKILRKRARERVHAVNVSIRVSHDLYRLMDRAARKAKVSLSAWMREAAAEKLGLQEGEDA